MSEMYEGKDSILVSLFGQQDKSQNEQSGKKKNGKAKSEFEENGIRLL